MSGPTAGAALSVWAPRAEERVEVELASGERRPLRRAGGGWWMLEGDPPAPGTDYGFRLDGAGPYPDPRSPCQPRGVHGPSRRVDHGAFRWTDAGWNPPPLSSAVIYELHVGTFTPEGTFRAAIGRLDHLAELGVTHVELLPVAAFPGERNWGYDGVDLYAPHAGYGGPEGMAAFVDACHARGLAVLLDVVYNHLGPDGNYLALYGPYFTDRYRTPWGEAVNLDTAGSDEVRRFFVDNARHWLERYHVDGLRLDAVHAFHDRTAIPFLEELAVEVEALEARLGRRLVLIAESDLNDPRLVRSRQAGGYGLDAAWSDDLHHALHALLTGEQEGYYRDYGSFRHLARALRQGYVYSGQRSAFRGRRHGRPATGLTGHHLLGYLQNHDQVGNRARGERIGHLVPRGRVEAGSALVLTSPFVPLLFQGEEWGASAPFLYFTDHPDPELGRAVREGRRREFSAFGWDPEEVPDPQSGETFRSSKLDWSEIEREPHASLLSWYRELVRLRRERSDLTDGRMDRVQVAYDEARRWLVMRRGRVAVAAGLAGEALTIPVGGPVREVLLASEGSEAGDQEVRLRGDGVAIVETDEVGKEER